jgi:hypothetical protein
VSICWLLCAHGDIKRKPESIRLIETETETATAKGEKRCRNHPHPPPTHTTHLASRLDAVHQRLDLLEVGISTADLHHISGEGHAAHLANLVKNRLDQRVLALGDCRRGRRSGRLRNGGGTAWE